MKNVSFFLNLRKRKLHVEILRALHEFCGHLRQSCQGKTPSKGRYKFKTFSNTFGLSLIFDVRETKVEKTTGLKEMIFLCCGTSYGEGLKIVKSS